MEKRQRYAPELPLDLLPGILLQVPAESLARLKGVCKSWYGLITDEAFVRSHLEHWKSSGRRVLISGEQDPRKQHEINLLTLNLEDEQAPRSPCDEIRMDDFPVQSLRIPEIRRMRGQLDGVVRLKFLHSCDGLLLLEVSYWRFANTAQHLLVCNPITKRYKLLPPHPSFSPADNFCWFIASDEPLRRYKVIGIERFRRGRSPGLRCFIFELRPGRKSGSWNESLVPIRTTYWYGDLFLMPRSYVSVGRNVHWLTGVDPGQAVVLSLDLSTERFTEKKTLNSPVQTDSTWHWFPSDKAMCFGRTVQSSEEIEVWILDDFDRPVWRRHHVITNYPQGLDFPLKDYDLGGLLYMEEVDELIIRMYGDRFVYKMSSREWRRIAPPAEDHSADLSCRHVSSLVGGCG